jgi:hypothetical protein
MVRITHGFLTSKKHLQFRWMFSTVQIMKHDLLAYRAELQRKLNAVDAIIADMGGSIAPSIASAPRSTNGRRKGKRKMSQEAKDKIAAAQRLRWKKQRAAG